MKKDFSHLALKEDFITAVAIDCITDMSEEDKGTMLKNPDASYYHFGYGIYIRNIYLYPYTYKFRFYVFKMERLSASIIEKIIALLQQC